MTDMDVIWNYLGISVNYDRTTRQMELDQSEYIDSLAKKYKVNEMRSFRTKNLNLYCVDDNPLTLLNFLQITED